MLTASWLQQNVLYGDTVRDKSYPSTKLLISSVDDMALNTNPRAIRDEVKQGEVFVDERESEHYTVVAVGKNGVTLTRENREYYIPHSIFARWYTSPDIERTDDRSNTAPEENSQR